MRGSNWGWKGIRPGYSFTDAYSRPTERQVQRLTSEAFDLSTDRSLKAEEAILRARTILRQVDPTLSDIVNVHADLRATLPDIDRFRCGGVVSSTSPARPDFRHACNVRHFGAYIHCHLTRETS